MFVKIGKLPGKIQEVTLDNGSSVAFALYTANLDPSGYEVRLNGAPADSNTVVEDGDTILLVKKIKGNAITVRVGRLPGKIVEIALDDGRTVGDALQVAGLDPAGYEVRANGAPCSPSTMLENSDTVLLVKKIKGNQEVIYSVFLNGEEYVMDVPMNVHSLLRFAGVKIATGDHMEVNGRVADTSQPVADGDKIQVVRLGDKAEEAKPFVIINGTSFPLWATAEASTILEGAGFSLESIQRITINGRWRKLCAPVSPGDEVTVVFKDEVVGICPRPIPQPALEAETEAEPETEADDETTEAEQLTIAINGLAVSGTATDLRGLIMSITDEVIAVTVCDLNIGGRAKDIRAILDF